MNQKKLIFIILILILVSLLAIYFFTNSATEKSNPSISDKINQTDNILAEMELGTISYNAPDTLNMYDSKKFILQLSVDTLKVHKLNKNGNIIVESNIQVSDQMKVILSGNGFQINALTPEVQSISRSHLTEWQWVISPIDYGSQHLYLSIIAIFELDGQERERMVQSYDKKLEVEVTWLQLGGLFISKNWQWLWTVIVIPLVGYLYKFFKRREKNQDEDNAINND